MHRIVFFSLIIHARESSKINELIQSSQTGIYFFPPQPLVKIPVFELNNRFAFHRT